MNNVWSGRFTRLTENDVRSLSAFTPDPLLGLAKLHYAEAAARLEKSMNRLFVATDQTVGIMQSWLAVASQHAKQVYPDLRTVRAAFNSPFNPTTIYFPYCLVGLGGTGKTALFDAFQRLLNAQTIASLGEGIHDFELYATARYKLEGNCTRTSFLRGLASSVGGYEREMPVADLLLDFQRKVHRAGVGFVLVDEFQHATGSANANVRAAQLALLLPSFGVPGVFASNYSMCHKLMRRPQEDRDRIFSKVMVLAPEAAQSEDWYNVVNGFMKVIPDECDSLSLQLFADFLHPRSFGLKRQVANLFRLAFVIMLRAGKRRLSLDHFEQACSSREYSTAREDIQILQRQAIIREPIRNDLWCPFPSSDNAAKTEQKTAEDKLEHDIVRRMIESTSHRVPEATPPPPKAQPKKTEPCVRQDSGNVVPINEGARNHLEAGMNEMKRGLRPKK